MDIDQEILYYYKAKLTRVVDGDTYDVMLDLGLETYRHVRLRLYGTDTPEVYGRYASEKRKRSF